MFEIKSLKKCAVVKMVEWQLPRPEICSLNPVIGNFYLQQQSTVLKGRK